MRVWRKRRRGEVDKNLVIRKVLGTMNSNPWVRVDCGQSQGISFREWAGFVRFGLGCWLLDQAKKGGKGFGFYFYFNFQNYKDHICKSCKIEGP